MGDSQPLPQQQLPPRRGWSVVLAAAASAFVLGVGVGAALPADGATVLALLAGGGGGPGRPLEQAVGTIDQDDVVPLGEAFKRAGIQHAMARDFGAAEAQFRAAAFAEPRDSNGWELLGTVLSDMCDMAAQNVSWRNKCAEADRVLERAVLASETTAIRARHAAKLAAERKKRNWDGPTVGAHSGHGCRPADLRITLSAAERRTGVLTLEHYERASATFDECGVLLLDGAYETNTVQALALAQAALFSAHRMAGTKNRVDAEFAPRGERRFEVKVPMEPPFTDDAFVLRKPVTDLVSAFVGDERATKLEIDTLSSVSSTPSAPHQHWHRDVPNIFNDDAQWQSGSSSPAWGVVVFVPLGDLPREQGPTKFLVRSHRGCAPAQRRTLSLPGGFSSEECEHVHAGAGEDGGVFEASASAGSAVFFDLRTLHSGGPNQSNRTRSQMYLTYVHEWWVDAVNFHSKQTKGLAELSPTKQKLLSRVDRLRYVEALERAARDRGVDLAALGSIFKTKSFSG
jgi:hypothetical protein